MNSLVYSSYARHENPHLIPISGNNQPQSLKSTHRQPCLAQPTHIHPSLTQQTLSRAAAVARHQANEPCQFHPVSSPSHGYCPSPECHRLYWSMTAASQPMNPPCTANGLLGPAPSPGASCFSLFSEASDHVPGASVKLNSCGSLFSLPRIPTQQASLPFLHLPGN